MENSINELILLPIKFRGRIKLKRLLIICILIVTVITISGCTSEDKTNFETSTIDDNFINEKAILDQKKAKTDLNEEDAPEFCNLGNRFSDLGENYDYNGKLVRDMKYYAIAIESYDEAIKLNPAYADAYNNRGFAYSITGDFNKAEEDFIQSIKMDPKSANAYYNLGKLYIKLGDRKRADLAFEKAEEIDPLFYYVKTDYWGYGKLAMESLQRGNYDKAIHYYTKAIELEPDQEINQLYYSRGYVYYFYKKEYQKAIEDFTKQIELSPENGYILYNIRGKAYKELGMNEKAEADFIKALEMK